MKTEELRQIADTYHTPCYVFDLVSLKERICAAKQLIDGHYRLCFSMKANPFLAEEIAPLVDQVEVCSPGELAICRRKNIVPEKILYSGVNKGSVDVDDAVGRGCTVITAESVHQLDLIEACGARHGQRIPVLLRLTSGNQFGMDLDEIYEILASLSDYPHVCVQGLHYFAGTQRNVKSQKKDIAMLMDIYSEVRKRYGIGLARLEYGPGLMAYLFAKEDRSDTLKPLRDIQENLCQLAEMTELTVECGRFMCAYCGYYLTSAADVKTSKGTSYCIVDGGIHQVCYDGSMMGMNAPEVVLLDGDVGKMSDWCVCGSLCTVNDVLIRRLHAPLGIGSRLAFCNAGAYAVSEGMSLFLSRQLPAVVFHREEGNDELVRDFIDTGMFNAPEKEM